METDITALLGSVHLEAEKAVASNVEIRKTGGTKDDIRYIDVKWESDTALTDLKMTLWVPLKEIHALWNPSLRFNKGFDVDWVEGFRSEAVSWAPVISPLPLRRYKYPDTGFKRCKKDGVS